jgi:hypothetical protein
MATAATKRRPMRREDVARGTFATDGGALYEIRAVRETVPRSLSGRLRDGPREAQVLLENASDEGAEWVPLQDVMLLEFVAHGGGG